MCLVIAVYNPFAKKKYTPIFIHRPLTINHKKNVISLKKSHLKFELTFLKKELSTS